MIVSSKRLTNLNSRRTKILRVLFLVGFLTTWIICGILIAPKIFVFESAFLVVLIIIWSRKYRRKIAQLNSERGPASIDRFIKKMNPRDFDPLVIRIIYNEISKRAGSVQIFPDDSLQQTYDIFEDDVIEILVEIDRAFSLTKEDFQDFAQPVILTPLDLIKYSNQLVTAKYKRLIQK